MITRYKKEKNTLLILSLYFIGGFMIVIPSVSALIYPDTAYTLDDETKNFIAYVIFTGSAILLTAIISSVFHVYYEHKRQNSSAKDGCES